MGGDSILVAANALAARQWEAYVSGPSILAGAAVWTGLHATSYGAWTRDLWSQRVSPRAGLLTARQSGALWRRVVSESPEADELIGTAGMARWAEDAWRRLARAGLQAPPGGARDHEQDFAAFLRWRRTYLHLIEAAGWIDEMLLDAELTRSAGELPRAAIVLADMPELAPSQRALLDRLDHLGWSISHRSGAAAAVRREARSLSLPDARDEIRAAVRWARRRLAEDPSGPVAIVAPDLDHRGDVIKRIAQEELQSFVEGKAAPAAPLFIVANRLSTRAESLPLIGAALNALGLLSSRGSTLHFSRWLRSAVFQGDDPVVASASARLDARLRLELYAQLPFAAAYRSGLREAVLQCRADLALRLDAALAERAGAARHTPAHWINRWLRLLKTLGWPGLPQSADLKTRSQQLLWERACGDFASLTHITGSITYVHALSELEASLRQTPIPAAMPVTGVHVVGDIADVGPGFAGVWVTGATATALPRATQLNPLLPRVLQIEHGMAWASPQDALRRSRALVSRLRERVPVCVFSWPAREDEQFTEPSPLIRELARLNPDRVQAAGARGTASDRAEANRDTAVTRDTASDRAAANGDSLAPFAGVEASVPVGQLPESARVGETVSDDAPPLPGTILSGGTAALNAQAHCPLHAFCTYRLGAHPLEPFTRGIPVPLQGLAVHAALERFFGIFDSLEALSTASAAQRLEQAQHCADEALAAVFGGARSALSPLFEVEHQRLTSLIEKLAAKEMQRSAYRVVARERREALQIAGRVVTTRIDRVDALEDGSFAILDYKSGRGGQPSAWFEMRPRDVQLPVYALTLPHVTALVFVNVRSDAVGYAGCWQAPGDFPGRSRAPQNATWPTGQIEAWRGRIGMLVDEYAAGDTRIPVRDHSPAEGALAPLTRVYEQVALYRGWLAPWPA